ncbi:restriction endonuclease subunit S [Photobacterium leiognathi]|uniref:restriction endonuclease subunit S n=1 Tax=Photobacterium leiognathi TaxID=553611 RepID=UPI0029821FD3|nr:restriction endonuclease subunit S [Photobacterium leiognathi]
MSWPLVALKDLVDINIGRTPSRNNTDYWGDGMPWLSIRDMNQGKILLGTAEQITHQALKDTKIGIAKKGTILFSFKLSIGKVGVAGLDMCHNEAIASMPIKQGVELCEEYLFYALKQLDPSKDTDRAVMGATLNKKKMAELKIPLPPLKTQKKIAAVLEKADQLRKDCQQMEKELNSLDQSVFIDMFGDPVTNPKRWESVSLESLAKVQIGPFGSQLHKEDYISDGIPLINPTHIINGQIVPDMNLTLTPDKFGALPNYHLQIGDIVMGRRGEMGRTALIDECSQGWFCGTGSLFIRITSQFIHPAYLNSVMSCRTMKTWLEEQSLGATMPNLNKKILYSIQIPIPTKTLQKKYVAVLDLLRRQKNEQKEHIIELNELFNTLMQKAFKGELNL